MTPNDPTSTPQTASDYQRSTVPPGDTTGTTEPVLDGEGNETRSLGTINYAPQPLAQPAGTTVLSSGGPVDATPGAAAADAKAGGRPA